ncbi:hypothetical protein WMY93_007457 [Mugilogobius chulae]|uniref:Stonustoxin-like helical domain-containing protein n=1 Tax=Mugilogobius chulae TaxID=88201 RepID=A0AAW0PP67_9GOBI
MLNFHSRRGGGGGGQREVKRGRGRSWRRKGEESDPPQDKRRKDRVQPSPEDPGPGPVLKKEREGEREERGKRERDEKRKREKKRAIERERREREREREKKKRERQKRERRRDEREKRRRERRKEREKREREREEREGESERVRRKEKERKKRAKEKREEREKREREERERKKREKREERGEREGERARERRREERKREKKTEREGERRRERLRKKRARKDKREKEEGVGEEKEEMDHRSGKALQMPALGRPFNLGMLYDCREDAIVPGLTLWDLDHLRKDTGTQIKPNSEFEIVASESIEDKSSALNVEASLKASLLCGLVEIEGSAKYLNDQKSSKHQARVTLKYNVTTRFEELTMKHLGRGNAFFVFDREVSKTENQQDIQGNLQAIIKKIPTFSIEGRAELKMSDTDKANTDKFSCKFFGDFNLEKNPVTFVDAVEVYQSLPKLLGADGENAVPVKVWLLPLTALDSSAAKLVREISVRLVKEAQSVLEDFNDLELRCNDALKTKTVQIFPQISKKIKAFKDFCTEFRLDFQSF